MSEQQAAVPVVEQRPETTERLRELLERIDVAWRLFHAEAPNGPAGGSRAASDVALVLGHLPITFAMATWAAAAEHLIVYRELIHAGVQPMAGHYALLRGALEGAAITRWLVDPGADQSERLRRAAAMQSEDHRQRGRFERSMGITDDHLTPPAMGAAQRLAAHELKMGEHDIDKIEWPKYTRLVADYGLVGDLPGDGGRWAYQALSGIAHHLPWALLFSDRTDAVDIGGVQGSQGIIVTASDQYVLVFTRLTVNAVIVALNELLAYTGRRPKDGKPHNDG